MLRRKLLLFLAPLVFLLLATTAASIWLLQGVLADLRHVKESAWTNVENINDLSVRIHSIEVDLYELQTNRSRHLDSLIGNVDAFAQRIIALGTADGSDEPAYAQAYARILERLPYFQRHVGALATSQNNDLARQHNEAALEAAVAIQQDTLPLGQMIHRHAQQEQEELLYRFRWLVLGMGLVFLLVINVAVLVLMRTAAVVLRPVDRLVEATRQLTAGQYDCRVKLDGNDEFGQLARAYNTLAQQLQEDEKQRMEMLGHVSLTMNHEINNAVAIIEMQLQLIQRRQGQPGEQTQKCLQQIQASLDRMTRTVQALKDIKRIVLTDYAGGEKMLDLEQSTQSAPANEVPTTT